MVVNLFGFVVDGDWDLIVVRMFGDLYLLIMFGNGEDFVSISRVVMNVNWDSGDYGVGKRIGVEVYWVDVFFGEVVLVDLVVGVIDGNGDLFVYFFVGDFY